MKTTVSFAHSFKPGDIINVKGCSEFMPDGRYTIIAIEDGNTFDSRPLTWSERIAYHFRSAWFWFCLPFVHAWEWRYECEPDDWFNATEGWK